MSNTRMKEVTHKLYSLRTTARTLDERKQQVVRMMNYLDVPLDMPKIIHITGTNGKGSVAYKWSRVLSNYGFKTGLFTSPHVYSIRERIRINSELISEDDFLDWYDQVESSLNVLGTTKLYDENQNIITYVYLLTDIVFQVRLAIFQHF